MSSAGGAGALHLPSPTNLPMSTDALLFADTFVTNLSSRAGAFFNPSARGLRKSFVAAQGVVGFRVFALRGLINPNYFPIS